MWEEPGKDLGCSPFQSLHLGRFPAGAGTPCQALPLLIPGSHALLPGVPQSPHGLLLIHSGLTWDAPSSEALPTPLRGPDTTPLPLLLRGRGNRDAFHLFSGTSRYAALRGGGACIYVSRCASRSMRGVGAHQHCCDDWSPRGVPCATAQPSQPPFNLHSVSGPNA